jgi:sulfide:quinone oxidoreductase
VTNIDAAHDKITMSNGKTFTYKALVLAPGFESSCQNIKGLDEMSKTHEKEGVFIHMLDNKERTSRNFYHGFHHTDGDLMCYAPKFPYKGEGSTFYALYYERMMMTDKMAHRTKAGARVQFWTPNKEIFEFPYANEVALDECHKRGVDVMFGWEMIEVKYNEVGQKIAIMKNVDSGEVIEKDFMTLSMTPASKTHDFLAQSGLTDSQGLIDVNKYTLQHNKYDNIFAFGDAINFKTTRTHSGALAQNPIIKNNIIRFLEGKELNGVYDGYSFIPMYLGQN